MHAVNEVSPYIQLIQIGLIVGIVNMLVHIPALKPMGIPAVSMGMSLFMGSIFPKFFPNIYHAIFPTAPTWPLLIQFILIPTLGASAGAEIELHELKHSGRAGMKFVVTSMLAPIACALPFAIGLALIPTPFIQQNANFLTIFFGYISIVFMRALPTMIAFFRGNHWEGNLVKFNILGASFDDLAVFVLIQPTIAGLATGRGFAGILESGIAVALTGLVFWIGSSIIKKMPQQIQLPLALMLLFGGAGAAEVFGHVHLILSGIFWGLMMPKQIAHVVEEKLKGFVLIVAVPLFFSGLGITRAFDVLSWQAWIFAILCFVPAYVAHEFITARTAAELFNGNKAAGKVSGALCRTHGTADILLAVSLKDMGIFTNTGLSGAVIYLMVATIQAFRQAQNLADQHPELAHIRVTQNQPSMQTFEKGLVFASKDEVDDD